MKNRSSIAIRNSSIGFVSQIVSVLFQFVTRSIFIQYLGVEMLGISSTFSSVLNTLSLAELGFHSAVVYNLYKPIAEGDKEKVNEIINVLKIIYRSIGVLFIVAGVLCLPFLKFILSGVEITGTIYCIFIIQVANSACSYFLAYKRTLLYADRREFMSKIVDTTANVIFSLLKIVVVIKTSNYLIYISMTTLQTIITNTIVHLICYKVYPYLHRTKFNKKLFKEIFDNVKNIFVAKIAYYVYTSTDNIVISAFVSTISVGYMVNYTTIISNLKTLANSIFNPITPIIGNLVAESKGDLRRSERIMLNYTFIRYFMTCIVVLPTLVLIQSFISAWIGSDYLLSNLIVALYCLDLYIYFVHGPLVDFINTNGLFKKEKYIEIVGALCNIVTSVILANILGIAGVLIGTVFSQMVFWIGRCILAYHNCFPNDSRNMFKYWIKNIIYFAVFCGLAAALTYIYSLMTISFFPARFIFGGIVCECAILLVFKLIFGHTEEYNFAYEMIVGRIKHIVYRRK